MTAASPGAAHCAAAVVAGCREVGEDPVEVILGLTPSRGRAYAFHALRACFADLKREAAARLSGAPDARLAMHSMKVARYQTRWWSPEALDRVVDAVRGVDRIPLQAPPPPPTAAAPETAVRGNREEFTTDVAPRPTPARRAQDHWTATPTKAPRRAVDNTADICGDPAPGRSALDQRRARRTGEQPETGLGVAPLSSARIAEASSRARAVNSVDRQEEA